MPTFCNHSKELPSLISIQYTRSFTIPFVVIFVLLVIYARSKHFLVHLQPVSFVSVFEIVSILLFVILMLSLVGAMKIRRRFLLLHLVVAEKLHVVDRFDRLALHSVILVSVIFPVLVSRPCLYDVSVVTKELSAKHVV